MKKRLLQFVSLLSLGYALVAQAESPCLECRKAALASMQQCMAAAKTDAQKSACTKQGQASTKSCDQGACKAAMGK